MQTQFPVSKSVADGARYRGAPDHPPALLPASGSSTPTTTQPHAQPALAPSVGSSLQHRHAGPASLDGAARSDGDSKELEIAPAAGKQAQAPNAWMAACKLLGQYRHDMDQLGAHLFMDAAAAGSAAKYAVASPWDYRSEAFSDEQRAALRAHLANVLEPFVQDCQRLPPKVLAAVRQHLAHAGANVRRWGPQTEQQKFVTAVFLRASYHDNDPVAFVAKTGDDLDCRSMAGRRACLREESRFLGQLDIACDVLGQQWSIPEDLTELRESLKEAEELGPIVWARVDSAPTPGAKAPAGPSPVRADDAPPDRKDAPNPKPQAPAQAQPPMALGDISQEVSRLEQELGISTGVSSSDVESMARHLTQMRQQRDTRQVH